MLWPHCLHGWIWYFSQSCRQCWRSLGMCDHRALGPHGYTSSSLVWAPRHGPSHHWASTQGLSCVTNRSRQPPPRRAENDNLGDGSCPLKRPAKVEHFSLAVRFRPGCDCLRPKSGRVCGWQHVMYMSMKSSKEAFTLVTRLSCSWTPTAIFWTDGWVCESAPVDLPL